MVYLDYASNHPVRKEVLDAFVSSEKEFYGNANSLHALGRLSHERYLEIDEEIHKLLKLDPKKYEIIYTSSATESNNLAIKGVYESYAGSGKKILTSEFEHNSVNATLSYVKSHGADVSFVQTGKDGKVSLSDLEGKVDSNTILMTLCMVESEVGVIQEIRRVNEILHRNSKAKLLVDATQAIEKIPFDFDDIDLISFAPHKFGGIIGTGVLIRRKDCILTPLLHGGKSESIYRSSTLPLGLIDSIRVALKYALDEQEEHFKYVSMLNKELRNGLIDIKDIRINSPEGNPYILNLTIDGLRGDETVRLLSEKGYCISQKSACSLPNTPSKMVMCMFNDKKRALSSVRISLSYLTKEEDINGLLNAIKEIVNE